MAIKIPDGMEVCNGCGGNCGCPGSDFGDHGWHPCYKCGEVGYLPAGTAKREEEFAHAFPERLPYDDAAGCAADYEEDYDRLEGWR